MRYIIAFLLGCLVSTVVFLMILGPRSYQRGRETGQMVAKHEICKRLPAVLGEDYRESDGRNIFFAVKGDLVVVVERNGVKTLRDIPDH